LALSVSSAVEFQAPAPARLALGIELDAGGASLNNQGVAAMPGCGLGRLQQLGWTLGARCFLGAFLFDRVAPLCEIAWHWWPDMKWTNALGGGRDLAVQLSGLDVGLRLQLLHGVACPYVVAGRTLVLQLCSAETGEGLRSGGGEYVGLGMAWGGGEGAMGGGGIEFVVRPSRFRVLRAGGTDYPVGYRGVAVAARLVGFGLWAFPR
jgi:hypothetical protein